MSSSYPVGCQQFFLYNFFAAEWPHRFGNGSDREVRYMHLVDWTTGRMLVDFMTEPCCASSTIIYRLIIVTLVVNQLISTCSQLYLCMKAQSCALLAAATVCCYGRHAKQKNFLFFFLKFVTATICALFSVISIRIALSISQYQTKWHNSWIYGTDSHNFPWDFKYRSFNWIETRTSLSVC